jgi:hypothetical protein
MLSARQGTAITMAIARLQAALYTEARTLTAEHGEGCECERCRQNRHDLNACDVCLAALNRVAEGLIDGI